MQVVERDTIKSVLQNIRVILTTPKLADVHRPDFGSEIYSFIDQPLTVLTVGKIKAMIVDEIERWEPRVSVKEINLDKDYATGRAFVRLTLEIENSKVVTTKLWM